jgi:23S rRNA pseudouridine1911/1915/1917 synthase
VQAKSKQLARQFRVGEADDCSLLAQYLRKQLEISGQEIKQLLNQRSVLVNGRRVWMAKHSLYAGDLIQLALRAGPSALEVLKSGEHWLVLSKPAGLVSTGEGQSAEKLLRKELAQQALYAVHRLDRDTSGCLLFARSQAARAPLESLFRRHLCTKRYLVLVAGRVTQEKFHSTQPISGQHCRSQFERLALGPKASLLAATIETGRMHQIRIHLAGLGYPVIGERQYLSGKLSSQLLRSAPRQMLHAYQLEFPSPWEEGVISCRAEPPEDFRDCARMAGLELGSFLAKDDQKH